MKKDAKSRVQLSSVAKGLSQCMYCPAVVRMKEKGVRLPSREEIYGILDDLIAILFPGCHRRDTGTDDQTEQSLKLRLESTVDRLRSQSIRAFKYQCEFDKCRDCGDCVRNAEEAVDSFAQELSGIQQMLDKDIVAAYEGDPAAKSTMEVVMSYPGVESIVTHRIAHSLYVHKVPLIPRIMSERTHARTGIDIHPGAKIGEGFFIDHGTGVVIGETCVIGKNVKLYQGVTLGALSFAKDERGNPVKGIKRHPEVRDNVVIYAGATILGADTIIGENSEIGGNVWLTHSVPANSRVYNQQPKPLIT